MLHIKTFYSPIPITSIFLQVKLLEKSNLLSFLTIFFMSYICANPVLAQNPNKTALGEGTGALIYKMNGDFSVLSFLTSLLHLTSSCFLRTHYS